MNLKEISRSDKKGQHAFLSPSGYHWVNYDTDKLKERYLRSKAAAKGTELHAIAESLIRNNIRQLNTKATFNAYVNDAIGYRMTPEVVLYYSEFCFGTVDAISFDNDVLRIHDLKTGLTPGSMTQLEVYAALFCLITNIDPNTIEILLRIYQNDQIEELRPNPLGIVSIMDKIRLFTTVLSEVVDE